MATHQAAMACVAAFALSGCAGLHLYSPSRDHQGQAAQNAWKGADGLASIQVERANTATILADQLAYLANASIVSRDKKLAALVFSQASVSSALQDPTKAALRALIGADKMPDELVKAQRDERVYAAEYAETMTHLAAWAFEPFACSDLSSGKADTAVADLLATLKAQNSAGADDLEQAIQRSASFCTSPKRTAVRTYVQHALASASTPQTAPQLFVQMSALYEMEDALAAAQQAHALDRNTFQAARMQYETLLQGKPTLSSAALAAAAPAAAASAASASASSTPVVQALAKLQAAFDKVKNLDDKYSLQFISKQRIDAIASFLGTLGQPKGADDPTETDLDRQARSLQMLDSTYATWVTERAVATQVLTQPLLMLQALDELTKEATTRSIAADAAKVDVQKARVALLLQQASHYDSANKYLALAGDFTKQPMRAVMLGKETESSKLTDARYSIAQAAAHYGYATGYLQGQLHARDLQDVALENARELDRAELNVRQWNALIDTNVDLIAAWSATGVKSDTISQAVNAALLLFIGIRVH